MFFLDNDGLNVDQKFFSNENETDIINSISENTTKIKVSFDFIGSMISHTGKSGALVQINFWSRCAK